MKKILEIVMKNIGLIMELSILLCLIQGKIDYAIFGSIWFFEYEMFGEKR